MPAARGDIVIRGGTVYDGSGAAPIEADVVVRGDRIAAIGDAPAEAVEIDAKGMAVAPGFVNVLSWATESLLEDGRGQSDVRQGVTLEVFGEGVSMGPLTPELKAEFAAAQTDIDYDIAWTTLDEYLRHLEQRGVAPNVASFVGAATVRAHVLGHDDRPPTPDELAAMKALVRDAMQDGALGVGAALIYVPGCYSSTDELVELASVAALHDGLFIVHMRSEGDRLLEALDEVVEIAERAAVRSEIYHLKAAGRANWDKLDAVIGRIEEARANGLPLTADMYPYTAGGTGLDAVLPPWVRAGGFAALHARLCDAEIRARVEEELRQPTDAWENLFLLAGPESIRFTAFRSDALRSLAGRTLADVAGARGLSPAQAAMQLIVEDESPIKTAYFMMSEDNLRREVALPWMSFCSDAPALAPEGVFLRSRPHPRAYGAFARVLGRYVRDEGLVRLEDAIRRLTSLPAENLRLDRRGLLKTGYFADVVVFDPAEIRDQATFDEPHRYATGVEHVLVNGTPVLRDGEHTRALPGRVVRGPGARARARARKR